MSNTLNLKVGMSSCGNEPEAITDELFESYKTAGIDCIEFSLPKSKTIYFDYGRLAELSNKHGVEVWSLHFPFMPFDEIDISNPELADHTVEVLADILKRACTALPSLKIFVIHPSGEPIEEDERRAVRIETAKKSLSRLAEIAKEYGATVAVEDLPRTCLANTADELLDIISAHPLLRVAFDVNHLLLGTHKDFAEKLGKYIVTTHISDYDFINERHVLPGEGEIDWQALIALLENIGYTGPWLYEIGPSSSKHITRSRDLTPEDFKRNAEELFAGKAPTIIPSEKHFI